ncbi:MAG TPA: hypothetical protein VMU06_01435 [Stellaceae bacterium]|nr:hypothetical protein [Stellaceae bacterium]
MQSGNSTENRRGTTPVDDVSRPPARKPWHAPVLKELDIALTADDRGHQPHDGKAGNDKDHS